MRPAAEPAARLAIATVCLSGTLEDKLTAAAAAGFDGVEIFEPDLVASPLSPAELRRHCSDSGLSIDLYQPFRDLDSTVHERFAANLRAPSTSSASWSGSASTPCWSARRSPPTRWPSRICWRRSCTPSRSAPGVAGCGSPTRYRCA